MHTTSNEVPMNESDKRPTPHAPRFPLRLPRLTFDVSHLTPYVSRFTFHVALLLLIAAFFRLWQIGAIPPGLFGDEATDGLDALDVLAGRGAVFFPANYGREGLHMWIVALMFRLVGVTPLALRLPSAIAGIATVLAAYWLGLELMRAAASDVARGNASWPGRACASFARAVPLLAALYVATSYWHVHFSRFGIRGVFTPLCGALAFAAFWRGVNRQSGKAAGWFGDGGAALWFGLAGVFLGLSLHFYTASRFFPFFLAGFLILDWLVARIGGRPGEAILRRHFAGIVLLFFVAALIFAPLAIYFLQHPGSFTQRAAEVAATKAADPLARMAQAALANVAQFFVPGAGDPEQFYNLPRRAVFDLPTALLALIGIGALARRWRTPVALFLLTWFPALLLPSFLATDRWPTLPRVLGTIPGVYFFPAVGLMALIRALHRGVFIDVMRNKFRITFVMRNSFRTTVVVSALALGFHAGATYRDYFRVWGPSQATFDAFEGDMTAAWQWLRNNRPEGHVYLSSDIYRHPTFMLLNEHATVQTIFTHRNEGLSWFDARWALPLPPAGRPATYLIGSSADWCRGAPPREGAPPCAGAQPCAPTWREVEILLAAARPRERVPAPDGSAALTVVELPAEADLVGRMAGPLPAEIRFTDRLTLVGVRFAPRQEAANWLTLLWRTDGPDPQGWPGYRLEVAGVRPDGAPWQDDLPFEAFRPPEWTPGGHFVTWHKLDVPNGEPLSQVRLRLLRAGDRQPLAGPAAADGWHAVPSE